MLTSHRQNIHHPKLPKIGAIVSVQVRPLGPGRRWRKWIVESFPLCDSADARYSWGIHTVNLRALDNGESVRVTGHYCEEV